MRRSLSILVLGLSVFAGTALSADRIPRDHLLCYYVRKDPRQVSRPKPYIESMEAFSKTRKASTVLYFFKFPDPLERSFASNEKGRIVQNRTQELFDAGYKSLLPSGKGPDPRPARLRTAAEEYRTWLRLLLQPELRPDRKPVPVPFEFLGAELYDSAGPPHNTGIRYDLEKVRAGYEAQPSDMRALVCLELALIERDLGLFQESEKTVQGVIERLNLLNVDFRKDAEFRQHLRESNNFDRPECVLLFVAGDNAARAGNPRLAEKYYSALIEGAPASPFAWEAFCKLPRLADVDQGRVKRMEEILIGTYPLVWGCHREMLKLEPHQVKSTVSTLLRTVEPQRVARYEDWAY